MANVNEIFTDIANAIRKKGGSTDKMKPSEMASKINELPSPSMKDYFDANPNGGYYFAWGKNDSLSNPITNTQLKKCLSYSDTSNVTNMAYMFNYCTKLTSIPELDTQNVTNMDSMFYYCTKLTSIPELDTQNVTNMEYMFYYCANLTSIPELDTQNVTNMAYMFKYCTNLTEINMINIGCNLDVTSTELKHNALVKLINNLKSGVTSKTLTMGSSKLALLSDEEKKVATDKGWTLA
jgi:surface protein